jgi:hypothetical protein
MQNNSAAQHWCCDDCWLMAGERPEEGSRRIEAGSDRQGDRPAEEATAKRRRLSTVHRLGWVTGANVLDANGVEHTIQAMQHGYVQCNRPGEAGCRNYRRKELQLLLSASDGEESRSSTSDKDDEDPSSDDASDREDSLEDAGMAAEGPWQDSSDEL